MPAGRQEIDAFWQRTLAEVRHAPLEAQAEPVSDPAPYHRERITLSSWGDCRIVAQLARPIQVGQARRLPAIITLPGYGGWEFGQLLGECQRGVIVLQVYPRMQGESGPAPEGPPHLLRGIESPERYYYRDVYIDVVRAVDYLATRPDVDPERIGIMGTSQGGGIGLAVTALDPRVRALVAHLPFFCDVRHNRFFDETPLKQPAALEAFDYFDPVNLAPRITAPVLLSSGGKDTTCPPATIQAVFDRLRGVKSLYHEPELTHTSSVAFHRLSWQWMEMYL